MMVRRLCDRRVPRSRSVVSCERRSFITTRTSTSGLRRISREPRAGDPNVRELEPDPRMAAAAGVSPKRGVNQRDVEGATSQ